MIFFKIPSSLELGLQKSALGVLKPMLYNMFTLFRGGVRSFPFSHTYLSTTFSDVEWWRHGSNGHGSWIQFLWFWHHMFIPCKSFGIFICLFWCTFFYKIKIRFCYLLLKVLFIPSGPFLFTSVQLHVRIIFIKQVFTDIRS